DSQLDDKHLREMAGTFSRRLHAFCAKQGIPIIEAGSGERNHELAAPHVPKRGREAAPVVKTVEARSYDLTVFKVKWGDAEDLRQGRTCAVYRGGGPQRQGFAQRQGSRQVA